MSGSSSGLQLLVYNIFQKNRSFFFFSLFVPGEQSVPSLKFVKNKPVFFGIRSSEQLHKSRSCSRQKEKVNHGDKRLKSGSGSDLKVVFL